MIGQILEEMQFVSCQVVNMFFSWFMFSLIENFYFVFISLFTFHSSLIVL